MGGKETINSSPGCVVHEGQFTKAPLIVVVEHLNTNQIVYVHGKYVYSTLALEKEREIVKEETALRKEKEAVCCYVHVHV